MNLETYAARHGSEVCDWSETWDAEAANRGWKCLAVFANTDGDEMEPDMLLIKSPRYENFQVRNLHAGIPSGRMLTEKEVKQWIKERAAQPPRPVRRKHQE